MQNLLSYANSTANSTFLVCLNDDVEQCDPQRVDLAISAEHVMNVDKDSTATQPLQTFATMSDCGTQDVLNMSSEENVVIFHVMSELRTSSENNPLIHENFGSFTGESGDAQQHCGMQDVLNMSSEENSEENNVVIFPELMIQNSSCNLGECAFSSITNEGSGATPNDIMKKCAEFLLIDLLCQDITTVSEDFVLFLLHDLYRENSMSSSEELISFAYKNLINSQQNIIIQRIIHTLAHITNLTHISKKSALFTLSEIAKMPEKLPYSNAKMPEKLPSNMCAVFYSRINSFLHAQNLSQEMLLLERQKCMRSYSSAENGTRLADDYKKFIEILEKMIHYLNHEKCWLTNNDIPIPISQDIIDFLLNDLLCANRASSSEDLISIQKISYQNLLVQHIIHILQNQTTHYLTHISKKSALFILSKIMSLWKWDIHNNTLNPRIKKILQCNASQDGIKTLLTIKKQCATSKKINFIDSSIFDCYAQLINLIEKIVDNCNANRILPSTMKSYYKKSHKTTTIRKAKQQTASYTMIKKAKRQKYDDCNNQTHHTIPHTITTITHNETLAATNSITRYPSRESSTL